MDYSKKHYIQIASLLKEKQMSCQSVIDHTDDLMKKVTYEAKRNAYLVLVSDFAVMFSHDNELFDETQFYKAAVYER